MGFIDTLLANELPSAEVKEYKIKRLSIAWNTDVTIKLKSISYNRVSEIKRMDNDDVAIHIILAGDADGVFKDKDLASKFNTPTPVELVKKILLPGEIEEISKEVEKLSGYRMDTIEEIKKN